MSVFRLAELALTEPSVFGQNRVAQCPIANTILALLEVGEKQRKLKEMHMLQT